MLLADFALLLASKTEAEQSQQISENVEFPVSAIAIELRRLCYDAWMTEPAMTGRIATAMRLLCEAEPASDISGIRSWVDGILALTKGEMSVAAELLERSFSLFVANGKMLDAAETSISRMYALAVLGRYEEAIQIGEAARNIFLDGGVPKSAGKIEHNLGNIYQRLDRYSDAEQVLMLAASRFSDQDDAEKIIQIENSLANAYAFQTKFSEAELLYEKGLKTAELGCFSVTQAEIESNLGYLSLLSGDYARCINLFERSRGRYASMGMEHQASIAEQELADVYLELNLFPEARNIYDRIIPLFAKLGMQAEKARALAFLAKAEMGIGVSNDISKFIDESRNIYRVENNDLGLAIVDAIEARWHLANNRPELAVDLARSSSKLFRSFNAWPRAIDASIIEAEALLSIGDLDATRQVIISADQEADRLHLGQSTLLCQIFIGRLEMEKDDHFAAEKVFLKAIDLIEGMRSPLPGEDFQAGFVADKMQPYSALTKINLVRGTKESIIKAFEFTERFRSRVLLDRLEFQYPNKHNEDAETKRLIEENEQCLRALSWFHRISSPPTDRTPEHRKDRSAEIRQREDQISELTRRIAARSKTTTPISAVSVDVLGIQKKIGSETALIEFVAIDGNYAAFVITNEGIWAVENLAKEADVKRLLGTLDGHLKQFKNTPDRASNTESIYFSRQSLKQLFDALLHPLLGYCDHRNLVIVPFQDLNYVPFHALFDGFEYMIETRDVVYAPSSSIFFREGRAATSESEKVVLFIGSADERAPEIAEELRTLASLVPNSQLFIDAEATLANLREHARSASILHLACHGKFRVDNPLFSSLGLYDGMLTVRDVYDLDLQQCRLAVLSACETGISNIGQGEELLGMIRGFLCAGVSSLIISMWQVDDAVSREMMNELYRSMASGVTPQMALANAQRKIMSDHPHPFFWAPFFMIGRSAN